MRARIGWADYKLQEATSHASRGYRNAMENILRALLKRDDVVIAEPRPGDPLVHFAPPHRQAHNKHYRNIAFSMWEGSVLPEREKAYLETAQVQVVPSTFCATVWQNAGLPKPVIAPLGINMEIYRRFGTDRPRFQRGTNYEERRKKDRPGTDGRLRFLFLGSRIQRKGWHLVVPAWKRAFANTKAALEVQLYIKIIKSESKEEQSVRTEYGGGVILDTRDLSEPALAELYGTADVFVFPTLAEGFGLPVLEAMAAGCLAIAPPTGGLVDFLTPKNHLPLARNDTGTVKYGDAEFQIKCPSEHDLARALRAAYENWGTEEVDDRRRMAWFDARAFSWDGTAQKVVEACFPRVRRREGIVLA